MEQYQKELMAVSDSLFCSIYWPSDSVDIQAEAVPLPEEDDDL